VFRDVKRRNAGAVSNFTDGRPMTIAPDFRLSLLSSLAGECGSQNTSAGTEKSCIDIFLPAPIAYIIRGT